MRKDSKPVKAILTIDDVASKNTPAIVDYLSEKRIPAIMFAYGQKLSGFPEYGAYALSHGIILGNHSYTHPHFSEISLEEGIQEIEQCEELLNEVYRSAGVPREYRPFRFPYGDKGRENKAALQDYLRENGFSKVRDDQISYSWWKNRGLDRDIDTLWTFDFAEYQIRPESDFTMEDVWRRLQGENSPLLSEGGQHIILLHAHDETEELVPEYYRQLLDALLEKGVQFVNPEFL